MKISDLKRKLGSLRMELDDPFVFKEIYRYSYDFAKVKLHCIDTIIERQMEHTG